MAYAYRAYFNRRWITYYARNIREAAMLAIYSFRAADGQPVTVAREQSGETRQFVMWRGRVLPFTMLHTVERA